MMRAVFDTNVLVSAFLFPDGFADRAFGMARSRQARLFTSVAILTEAAEVFRAKFRQSDRQVKDILRAVVRCSEVVRPLARLSVLDDEPDNRVLECAVEARADVIVSGDRGLLKLGTFRGIAVVRLADFLRMFPGQGVAEAGQRARSRRSSGRTRRKGGVDPKRPPR